MNDRFDLRAACQAKDEGFGFCRDLGRRARRGRPRRQQVIHGLVARMIQQGQGMAMLQDIERDTVPHHAYADNADFHLLLPHVLLMPVH
jgi:hypothetical protein